MNGRLHLRELIVGALAACLVANVLRAAEPVGKPSDAKKTDVAGRLSAKRFSVLQGPRGWSFIDPAGRPFFSFGVDVVAQGPSASNYDEKRPAYAAHRYYRSSRDWADATLRRLKAWGFSTIGGWADLSALNGSSEQTMWLMPVVPLGAAGGAPWLDMWDETNLARIEALAAERIDPLRDDPRVIGYYSDNELGWWNAALWNLTLEQPASSGQRQRLLKLLRERYEDDWQGLLKDFQPSDGVDGWAALERGGSLRHRPGGNGILTMRRFLALAADRYYSVMRDVIGRHDSRGLYLGDRYQSFYYPEVAQAASKHVDVVSTNLSAHWNDGSLLRCYLDSLAGLTGKPILVSEFYMSAEKNRSGNKNSSPGFPVVGTQAERAKAAESALAALAGSPHVVGAEWFQFADEPTHGRTDGEDYNFGLVDIDDRPYEELTNVFSRFRFADYETARTAKRLDATSGVPPAPADPFADFTFMTALKTWNRGRGFVPSSSPQPLADLYVCWKPEALYLGLYGLDFVERSYYADERIDEADRATWQVSLAKGKPTTIRLGAGMPPIADDSSIRVECLSGLEQYARVIAILEAPTKNLGKARLQPGDTVELSSTFTTHGRAYRFEWKGNYRLAD
jgi:hypothetical protein